MREKLRFLGLDVHAETITAAIVEPDGEVRSLGTIANREDSIQNLSGSWVWWSNCAAAMKRVRQDSCCTGNWRSWVCSAWSWHRPWYRKSSGTE
jgi:hypothetical protein